MRGPRLIICRSKQVSRMNGKKDSKKMSKNQVHLHHEEKPEGGAGLAFVLFEKAMELCYAWVGCLGLARSRIREVCLHRPTTAAQ